MGEEAGGGGGDWLFRTHGDKVVGMIRYGCVFLLPDVPGRDDRGLRARRTASGRWE